jgi:hypothetical protein
MSLQSVVQNAVSSASFAEYLATNSDLSTLGLTEDEQAVLSFLTLEDYERARALEIDANTLIDRVLIGGGSALVNYHMCKAGCCSWKCAIS